MSPLYVTTVLLPMAVAVVMFGLGLSLTPDDFARVARYPRAAIIGLLVQTVVLVPVAFGIAVLFGLAPIFAVGFMLLAASPGGAVANVFSHLAHGDVALNITLTAINSVIALAWMPLVLGWSLAYFIGVEQSVPPPTQKVLEVAAFILLPVVLGMAVRHARATLAQRAQRSVHIAAVILLGCVIVLAIVTSRDLLLANLASVGIACLVLNVISLAIGYAVPRVLGLPSAQSISIALEIGIHNAVVAMFVAVQLLDIEEAAVPAALYGIVMLFTAGAAVTWIRRQTAPQRAPILERS